jgi:shikimate kinase
VARVLITGMSGTGKSTVLRELSRRGHTVVDTDDPGWSEQVRTQDGDVEQLWIEPRLAALLADVHQRGLFVSGCVRNRGSFYTSFDLVVLLSAPAETMLRRIRSRASNSFGKEPAERDRILRDLAEVEPLLRAGCTVELRADRPLPEVVDAVEGLAARAVDRAVPGHLGQETP